MVHPLIEIQLGTNIIQETNKYKDSKHKEIYEGMKCQVLKCFSTLQT